MTAGEPGSAAHSPGQHDVGAPRRLQAESDEARQCPWPGQLLKRVVLGTEAIYRVIETSDRGVEIEVVRAPGLKPGSRFVFALKAVLAMDPLTSDDLRGRSRQGEAVASEIPLAPASGTKD